MIIALILIVIGIVFFAKALGFMEDDTLNILWPLLLVIVGLALLSNRTFGACCSNGTCWSCKPLRFAGVSKKKKGRK